MKGKTVNNEWAKNYISKLYSYIVASEWLARECDNKFYTIDISMIDDDFLSDEEKTKLKEKAKKYAVSSVNKYIETCECEIKKLSESLSDTTDKLRNISTMLEDNKTKLAEAQSNKKALEDYLESDKG